MATDVIGGEGSGLERRGGIALGVASDEVRRYGWNTAKRARLIRAASDYLVPDWSRHEGRLGEKNGAMVSKPWSPNTVGAWVNKIPEGW